jgi:cytochrome P450
MNALTLTIVSETLFGRDLSGEAADAELKPPGRARVAHRAMSTSCADLVADGQESRLPSRRADARHAGLRPHRRTAPRPQGDDLLGMLGGDADTGEGMSTRQLRDGS